MHPRGSNRQKRNLGLCSAAGVVVCGMVGAGIFTTTGLHAAELGSGWAVMLVWAVGGLLALCGTLTYIELAALWPEAGGSYVFVRNIYGPMSGFVVGLSVAIVGIMGSMAVVGLTLGAYFQKVVPSVSPGTAATVAVLVATLVHCFGVRESNAVNQLGALFKIILLTGLVCWGFSVDATAATPPPSVGGESTGLSSSVFGSAMAAVAFAYLGWDNPTYIAGEIRNTKRSLKWGMTLGMLAVTALYLLVNWVFLRAAAPHEMIHPDGSPVVDIGRFAAVRLFGETVGGTFNILILLVLFSTLSLTAMVGARVFYSMGRKGELPGALTILNRRGSPVIALAVQCAGALLLIRFTGLKDLLESVGVILTVISGATVLGVILLRIRRPGLPRPFRVPLYPVPPVIYLLLTVWMAWSVFRSNPTSIILTLGTIGVTLAIWFGFSRRHSQPPSNGDTAA
jgi:APA family basic amino acid/polyamine antiporter